MSSLRTWIAVLVWVVLFAATGFMTLSTGSSRWLGVLYTLGSVALLAAPVAARACRGGTATFWFGFAVVGWAFWLLGLGVPPNRQVNRYLLITPLLKSAHNTIKPPANVAEVGQYGNSLVTEYLLLTLGLAIVGGATAALLKTRRQDGASQPVGRARKWPPAALAWSVCTLAMVALIGTVAYLDAPHRSYFPGSVTDKDTGLYPGVVDEGRKALAAMREPSLSESEQTDPALTVYRCLSIPWQGHPIAVTVTKRVDEFTLSLLVLDGHAHSDPGSVAVRKTVRLNRADWDELAQHIKKAGFWSMPSRDDDSDSGGGGWLLLEGTRDGKYHAVHRDGPAKTDYFALCEHMLDMSGFDFKPSMGANIGGGFR